MSSPSTSTVSTSPSSSPVRTGESALSSNDGKISVAEGVVTKIAGLATREVAGVHSMGSGAGRTFGSLKERLPGSSGPNLTQGVAAEVGETQVALDLDIVIEYGVAIADLGRSIQRNVKSSIERMTGLEVTEVNVNVDDVYLGDSSQEESAPSRVQ